MAAAVLNSNRAVEMSVYVVRAFMTLIEKTFGTEVTTRTWDTVRKCAYA